jgi:hypothetical protein
MILSAHILAGAAMTKLAGPPGLVLSFLSHYFLDSIPHKEYSIDGISQKKWKESIPDFLKVSLDFFSGFFLVLLLSKGNLLMAAGGFLACLPDAISFLHLVFPESRILKKHQFFHQKIIHGFSNKKIPVFWKIFSQAAVIVAAILFLGRG